MDNVKDYISKMYKIYKSDYNSAGSQEEIEGALAALHQLKLLAAVAIGFDFADSLDTL